MGRVRFLICRRKGRKRSCYSDYFFADKESFQNVHNDNLFEFIHARRELKPDEDVSSGLI